MDSLRQDLRFAVRSLFKSPGFTAIAALCMALGIGANVFVYSPVNAILIRPLPYPEPHRVMHVNTWRTGERRETWSSWSYPDYRDLQEMPGVFSALGAGRTQSWNVGGVAEPERISGARVTASLFPMLGFRPVVGRFFLPDEDLDGKVAIISHGLWQRKFGGDSSVIGRAVTIDGNPYTLIGVMQEKVRYPEVEDLWLPLEPSAAWQEDRRVRAFQVYGRLAPGVTIEAANERIAGWMRTLAERYPDSNRDLSAWMWPISEDVASEVRPIFLTMVGAVMFVLLIACSNVANLLLARGSGRQRELAVRLSMGATRGRLVRQMLTESLLLALVGGTLGVLLGTWGTDLFVRWAIPSNVPFWMTFNVDSTVLLLTLAVTVLSGMAFGVAPAIQLSRPELSRTLKEAGGRGGSAHASIGRLRSGLVVAQLALSLVLLAGAALMMQSFVKSRTAPLGFEPEGVLTARMALSGARYVSDSARATAQRTLIARLEGIPGVQGAAGAGWLPVGNCCSSRDYYTEGRTYATNEEPVALFNAVTPGFFSTFKIGVLQGRVFTDADALGAERVVVINEVLAKREWPNESAIGKRIRLGLQDSMPATVIGVVANIVPRRVTDASARDEQLFVPFEQAGWRSLDLIVRTSGDPYAVAQAVRDAAKAFDPNLPLANVMSMRDVIRDRMFEGRVYGTMFAVFGVAALLLASIGLYGVMSYVVSQRTGEVGVRMALGAQGRDVMSLLLGSGARLLLLGVAIGLPAAVGLAQLLRGSLYGVTATDPLTFIAIPLILSLVALVASFIPARRATRVDPIVALRAD
jgi:putative ABC transport system permease protein